MPGPKRIVIIGGGLAGYSLAEALRKRGHHGAIVIVEQEPAMYDRPPLSKAAAFGGDAALENLAFAGREKQEALALDVIVGRAAMAIAPVTGDVTLDDGTVVVGDALVLATGGRARRLAFPGSDLPAVHVLRTFADAEAIREAAVPGARILVVGAGLIGAELTSSLRALGVDVTLIDPMETPLAPVVGQQLAERLHAMHTSYGVDVRVATLSSLCPSGAGWLAELRDGTGLDVDAVVVGAGILPNSELAAAVGLDVDDGIIVDEQHRTAHPRVYAIGDVARTRGEGGVLQRREEHWEAAQLDAQELAAVLLDQEPDLRGAPWWWSDRYHVHVEGVGRMTGDGTTVFRGENVAFHLNGDLVVGAVSVNDANAVRAARRLIDHRIAVVAAELGDPAVPLRDLLRSPRPAVARA